MSDSTSMPNPSDPRTETSGAGDSVHPVRVHVINRHSVHSHIEIVLEDPLRGADRYYNINRWVDEPAETWNCICPLNYYTPGEDSVYSFDTLVEDPDALIRKWKAYHEVQSSSAFDILNENCAVAVKKFVEKNLKVQDLTEAPDTWNHFIFGIMWPSFIPFPITLPGRVMDQIKASTMKKDYHFIPKLTSVETHTKIVKQKSEDEVKRRFVALTDFYSCLDELHYQSRSPRLGGVDQQIAGQLVRELKGFADEYVFSDKPETEAYRLFLARCQKSIEAVRPKLEQHRGWKVLLGNMALACLGVGVLYGIACCVNKRVTGNFLFFKQDKLAHLSSVVDPQPTQSTLAVSA